MVAVHTQESVSQHLKEPPVGTVFQDMQGILVITLLEIV